MIDHMIPVEPCGSEDSHEWDRDGQVIYQTGYDYTGTTWRVVVCARCGETRRTPVGSNEEVG